MGHLTASRKIIALSLVMTFLSCERVKVVSDMVLRAAVVHNRRDKAALLARKVKNFILR